MLPNAFPSDTKVNPKGECKAITLRNGKVLQESKQEELNKEVVKSTPTKLTKEDQDNKAATYFGNCKSTFPLPKHWETNAPLCQVHEGLDLQEEELERGGNYSTW
ncbi:hypothetical protein PIB30_070608 [Stylosanthes scabra]|uniref:Uncharacterized protein n=1 Tax=Stylosanthes scabra TaxID=79078 RepID=A0ABU6TQ38_9FABA|nr:hypothetical protein [Stylosanthes scabra]